MQRKKYLTVVLAITSVLVGGCSSGGNDLSEIMFTRADCISNIMGSTGDSTIYLDGYIEVSNLDIKAVALEVEDPTSTPDVWEGIDIDLSVDATGKAKFSFYITDYQKRHETWNFKIRAVARETTPTEWKNLEFKCPNGNVLNNLYKTK